MTTDADAAPSPPDPDGLRHPAPWAMLLACLPGAALYAWRGGFHGDEFTNLYNGVRLAGGAVIYKDFFEFTAPLSHWLAGWIVMLAGPGLVAPRLVVSAALLAGAWQLWRLSVRCGAGPWLATLPGLALMYALHRTYPGYNHHWVALPPLLGALLAGMRGLDGGGRRWWALAGALAGATLLMVQTDGLIAIAALAGTLAVQAALGGVAPRAAARAGLALAAGFVAPVALAVAHFAWHGALATAWHQVWTFPTSRYKLPGGPNDFDFATDLPQMLLPATAGVGYYLRLWHWAWLYALLPGAALVGLGWGLETIGRRLRGGPAPTPRQARFALVALAALGFMALATRGRADFWHVAVYACPALVVAAVACDRLAARLADRPLLKAAPAVGYALFVAAAAGMLAREAAMAPHAWLRAGSPDARLAELPVIAWIRRQTAPGDTIVGMPIGSFYYYYGRPPATRYNYMLPRSLPYFTEAEYEAFWAEALAARPKLIVVGPWFVSAATLGDFLPRGGLPGYRLRPDAPPLGDRPVWVWERVGDGPQGTVYHGGPGGE